MKVRERSCCFYWWNRRELLYTTGPILEDFHLFSIGSSPLENPGVCVCRERERVTEFRVWSRKWWWVREEGAPLYTLFCCFFSVSLRSHSFTLCISSGSAPPHFGPCFLYVFLLCIPSCRLESRAVLLRARIYFLSREKLWISSVWPFKAFFQSKILKIQFQPFHFLLLESSSVWTFVQFFFGNRLEKELCGSQLWKSDGRWNKGEF